MISLRPNLQRDQLEESEEARLFIQKLRRFYEDVEEEDRALSDKRNVLAKYRRIDETLDALIGNQALVVLTDADREKLAEYQRNLTADEETAKGKSNGKKNSHLRDPEVKKSRTKLLKDIAKVLTGADANPTGRQQTGNVNIQPAMSAQHAPAVDSYVPPPFAPPPASAPSLMTPRPSFPAPAEALVRPESARPRAQAQPSLSWAEVREVNSQGGDSESVQYVAVDVVVGLLEEILEELVPANDNLRASIMGKLRRRLVTVMTDGE